MNKIILGDAAKILGKLATNSIDLTVCSPPFDDLYKLGDFDFETIQPNSFTGLPSQKGVSAGTFRTVAGTAPNPAPVPPTR